MTNTGRTASFGGPGGSPFTIEQQGQVVKGFTLGFGGHLHFVGAHFAPLNPPPVKLSGGGKVHPDTTAFDDVSQALAGRENIELSELRILHDGQFVYGVNALYNTSSGPVDGGVHAPAALPPNIVNQSVPLPAGTWITGVTVRSGDIVDNISIVLNTGLSYSFGGQGGNPTQLAIPAGGKVRGIAGGFGGHLHNFTVYS